MPEKRYINLFMDTELIARIDEYRFTARFPTRTEAIRHLIDLGLQSAEATKTPTPPKPKAAQRK